MRTVCIVRRPLRGVQDRILRLLDRVIFPRYLMGGLRDALYPRSYVHSAATHCGSHVLLGEDIEQFFPSVRESHVRAVFKYVLRFPPAVAECLTRLCMRNGSLPQGASTSMHLALLVLFDVEPQLVERVTSAGFRYNRFVDDISASSRRWVPKAQRQAAIDAIQSALRRKGFTPKREKQELKSRGETMVVHGLNVDRKRPTITQQERTRVRAAVYEIEMIARQLPLAQVARMLNSAIGRALRVKQFHATEGRHLLARLRRAQSAARND